MKEKWLHSFEVEKTQKVKETTTEVNEAGEEIQITKEVEKKVPHKFYILKPNRKIQDEASVFYSVKVSEGIKLGLVTKNYLLRKFQQDGILASEDEKKIHADNYSKAIGIEIELEKIKQDSTLSQAEKDLKNETLNTEYQVLRQKIFDYENVQNSLFDNTAEKRASDALNLWFVLNLLYQGEDGSQTCLFGDGSFDQKVQRLAQIEESGDEFLSGVVEKGGFLIGQLNSGVPKEDLIG
jgi:hypothetical protein